MNAQVGFFKVLKRFQNFAVAYSTNVDDFRRAYEASKHLVVLTGAGVSAESGIPTFRGAGGLWKTYKAQELATPEAFARDPALVWEFYHYRQTVALSKKPNPGHYALVEVEKKFLSEGKKFTLITQNVDGFHLDVGSQNVIEMHGNIFTTRCTKCSNIEKNKSLVAFKRNDDGTCNMPKCEKCQSLLRPHIVWFHESLDPKVMDKIDEELNKCDLFLIVGTSGVVYPAAGFSSIVADRGVPIAEFNIDENPYQSPRNFYFCGPSGELLPKYLLKDKN